MKPRSAPNNGTHNKNKLARAFQGVINLRTASKIASTNGVGIGTYSHGDDGDDVKRKAGLKALIAMVFASVTSIKAAYAELQMAQHPYDGEAIQVADQAVVEQLKVLSELKHKFLKQDLDFSPQVTLMLAEIQEQQSMMRTYDITIKNLESDIEEKDSAIDLHHKQLEHCIAFNKSTEKKLNETGPLFMFDNIQFTTLNPSHFIQVLHCALKSVRSYVRLMLREMKTFNLGWLLFVAILLISALPFSQASRGKQHKVKTGVFRSPQIVLGPGSVANKLFSNIDFPRGHIALKSFDAEIIDESGNPIPLYDTYLHHWLVLKFYVRKGLENQDISKLNNSDYISGRNSGICQDGALDQFFGLGSETRKTKTHIPDPYGIEIGNPTKIPSGFVETWGLNVHAIDTRGVEDRMGCTECRCNLYNVTKEENGTPLSPNYDGGLLCCYDGTKCRLKDGFIGIERTLYLQYTVKWVDMNSLTVPVNVYIFDVSDTWKRSRNSTGINSEHNCQVEYQVESCRATGSANDKCIDAESVSLDMPFGGYLVYGVAHQHAGGTGSALYGKDGRSLCSSIPIYGTGEEAGNENGYIVGMSTCYPKPGTKKISKGETLTLESNYSSTKQHTGVMGLFYILVAETLA